MSEEGTILICMVDFPGHEPIAGAVLRECPDCERPIWIAPSGQRFLAENPNVAPTCIICAKTKMDEREKTEMRTVPGAGTELLLNGLDPITVEIIRSLMPEMEKDK